MKNSTAIVTGASSGLGLEIAVRLAKRGTYVFGVARHPPRDPRWDAITAAKQAYFATGDARLMDTAVETVRLAQTRGVYSLLFNCAGRGVFGEATTFDDQDLTEVFGGNLIGLINFCIKSIPVFAQSGGTIVNVISTAAQVGRANETIYCASKWGARGYTEALRVELKGKPIRILAVYPGGMKTEFWRSAKGHSVNPDKFMEAGECADAILSALDAGQTLQVTDLVLNRV